MSNKKQVAVSFLGTVLDSGFGQGRWQKWRPNVAMNQRQDFQLDRIELFYGEIPRTGGSCKSRYSAGIAAHSCQSRAYGAGKPVGFLRGLY